MLRRAPLTVGLVLLAAILLGGCAGRSAPPEFVLHPPETEVQPDWQPADAKPNHLALAQDLMEQGHYAVAMRQLFLAAEADSSDPEPYYLLGICQRETGNWPEAKDNFQHAVDRDRDYAPAYNGLGIAYFMKKQYASAHEAMAKAVSLNPADPDFLNDLGVLEMQTHRTQQALSRFRQCLRVSPDHVRAKNNMAECMVLLGRDDAALDFLEQHFPPAVACNNLGGIYERVGYRPRARVMFVRALALDPDLAAARRNLNRLETKENSQP